MRFQKDIYSPKIERNWLWFMLMGIITAFAIKYGWTDIPTANPGAKLGTGLGILSGLLGMKMFEFSPNVKIEIFLGIVIGGGFIGGAVFI